MARVLAQWPIASWGPVLDLMRLLLLYPGVALHYAGTSSSHTTIVVKRCLTKTAAPCDVPKGAGAGGWQTAFLVSRARIALVVWCSYSTSGSAKPQRDAIRHNCLHKATALLPRH